MYIYVIFQKCAGFKCRYRYKYRYRYRCKSWAVYQYFYLLTVFSWYLYGGIGLDVILAYRYFSLINWLFFSYLTYRQFNKRVKFYFNNFAVCYKVIAQVLVKLRLTSIVFLKFHKISFIAAKLGQYFREKPAVWNFKYRAEIRNRGKTQFYPSNMKWFDDIR